MPTSTDSNNLSLRWSHATSFLSVLLLSLFLTACIGTPERRTQQTSKEAKHLANLEHEVDVFTTENAALNTKVADLQLELLEKSSRIKQLREQQEAITKRLDDTIQEVVRTKAKLSSRNSKAESVTSLAELAIDLKSLKERFPEAKNDAQVTRAELLLYSSNQEFKSGNHAGAFYLANKTRNLIQSLEGRLSKQPDKKSVGNLIYFASALPMKATTKANVRNRPDIKGKPIQQIAKGKTVLAVGYQNLWVNIELEGGEEGWIYYSLLEAQ